MNPIETRHESIQLSAPLLMATGSERSVYLHPTNPKRCIKISTTPDGKQQTREYATFQHLTRNAINCRHLPAYYGTVQTNLGVGLMFERICDDSGETSMTLTTFLEREGLEQVLPVLEALKENFYGWNIITCDMSFDNFLVRKRNGDQRELVMIDGIGNREAIPFSSWFATLGRIKMKRRWRRFEQKLRAYACNPRHEVIETSPFVP